MPMAEEEERKPRVIGRVIRGGSSADIQPVPRPVQPQAEPAAPAAPAKRSVVSATEYDAQEKAKQIIAELKALNSVLKPFAELGRAGDDLQASVELAEEAGDDSFDDDIRRSYEQTLQDFEAFELRSMLGGPNDHCNAYVTIHAGAGGTEACDWAEMLLRMYLMWAEQKRFATQITNREDGGAAGIQEATVHIKGEYAYGYLRGETGVHRLIRISPFDASRRRQTSFASVAVVPEVDDVEVVVRDDEIRIDVFRSSGPGGQGVNTADSAVRITHLPTGIVVQCQNERSQLRNRDTAMRILKARLYELAQKKQREELSELTGEKKEIAFGSQIRTYTFHPYQLVKDHRTGVEAGNVDAVMDGEIDAFIKAYLLWQREAQRQGAGGAARGDGRGPA